MMKRAVLMTILVLSLVSCSSLKNTGLKSPKSIVRDVDEYQLICGKLPYMEDESCFEAWTLASRDRVEITLFLPTGQTFCTASWNGTDFEYQSGFAENGGVFAKSIINDLIDCYSREKSGSIIKIEGRGYSYTVETL